MIKKTSWLLGWLCISTISLIAQNSQPRLSLTQLLDSAVQRNYLLQANEKNIAIKRAEIEILKTNYQPRISASATASFWKFLLPNKQKLLGNSLTDVYTDITAYQTIYDWGEKKVRTSMVEDEILLNDDLRRQIRNTIIWGVSEAYFEALKAGSEVSMHLNAIQRLKSHLQYAKNLYQIGKVSGVDVLKIKVQISVEEKAQQKAQNAAIGQSIKLKRLCNLENSGSIEMEDTSEKYYSEFQKRTFLSDSLYAEIFRNHPVLKASDLKLRMEMKQKEILRLKNRPEIYSYGVASWEHGHLLFGDNFNYNIGVGIRYTIPYWGGNSYKSKMQQGALRIEQMVDEKNQTFLDIRKEIDLTLNEISDKRSEIANNEKIIRLTKETLDNTLVKYQSGQGPIIDVLDAESILTETTIAYRKSTLAYLQSLGKLNYLTGNDKYPF